MKRFLSILALGLAFALPAAARELPKDMEVAYMKAAEFPTVQLSSGGFSWVKLLTLGLADNAQSYQMTVGVRIRNQNNTFITHGALPQYRGNFIAFKRNNLNQIQEIWLLNDYEVDAFRQKAAEYERTHAAQRVN
ncbi:MAG: hypothetical protein IKI11_00770 [Neisseriaceae bacterium]|nr:hypothetical protein [Neisseriaceae bacterium]